MHGIGSLTEAVRLLGAHPCHSSFATSSRPFHRGDAKASDELEEAGAPQGEGVG